MHAGEAVTCFSFSLQIVFPEAHESKLSKLRTRRLKGHFTRARGYPAHIHRWDVTGRGSVIPSSAGVSVTACIGRRPYRKWEHSALLFVGSGSGKWHFSFGRFDWGGSSVALGEQYSFPLARGRHGGRLAKQLIRADTGFCHSPGVCRGGASRTATVSG